MPTPIPDSSTDREAVFFYEAFAEEADAIRRHLPDDLDAGFDWRTIQEAEHAEPPAQLEQFDAFRRDGLTGTECAGRTLLVVGVGRIGREVVRIGEGLGMRVLGVDIDKGLPFGDVIVCAVNLTDENAGYFDRARRSRSDAGTVEA